MATALDDYEYLERQVEQRKAEKGSDQSEDGNYKDDHRGKSRDRSRSRSRSRRHRRSRSRSRDRRRSRSRSRDRRHRRSRSRDRRRDRDSRDRRDRDRDYRDSRSFRRSRSPYSRRRERTPPEVRLVREKEKELAALERATRTIFTYNLHPKATERDIFEFFSKAGSVVDIKLITDKNSGKSKGMAYVELQRAEDMLAASTLAGQPLMGVPVMLKASEAEKNMQWEADQAAKQSAQAATQLLTTTLAATGAGPCKLRISNLHPGIPDADVKTFFEPFGAVLSTQVARDALGRPMGYAYVTFKDATEGANAMAHWNGKQLAGREVTVEQVEQKVSMTQAEVAPVTTVGELDEEEGAFKLTSSSRAQLMSKLAGAAGLEVPAAVLPLAPAPVLSQQQQQPALALEQGVLGPASPIPTPCLLLKNMFGDADKVELGWQAELEGDVKEECSKYGQVLHVHVDPASKGFVYLKFGTSEAAQAAHRALSGRFYSGNQIVADYQFAQVYSSHFGC